MTRLLLVGLISAIVFLTTAIFAQAHDVPNLPRTEQGLRDKIGAIEAYRECKSQKHVRICWFFTDKYAKYRETTKHSGWTVRCNFSVSVEISSKRCWIGGKGITVSVIWRGAEHDYETLAIAGTSRYLNGYAPIYISIDNTVYLSPEDAPYGDLAPGPQDGDKILTTEFLKLIEKANSVTTATWDEYDQERSVTDRGVGVSPAHQFALGFLDGTL